jgi:triosephosphate isomerase
MHGSASFVRKFCIELRNGSIPEGVTVVLLPPVAYLGQVVAAVASLGVECGAQNAHSQASGAYTGETAPEMVKDLGGAWVLIGHSERRRDFVESDELLAGKFTAALRAGLQPILCVGETMEERDAGRAEEVVRSQIRGVANRVGADAFAACTLAYEPVWAIGTGATATPAQAQAMHAVIRAEVVDVDRAAGQDMRLLYGGSMNADNAAGLLCQADIDGGLIGGASLQAREFLEIVRRA